MDDVKAYMEKMTTMASSTFSSVSAVVSNYPKQAQEYFTNFSNVEGEVVADLQRNERLRNEIASAKDTLAKTKKKSAANIQDYAEGTAAIRAAFEADSKDWIDAIDEISLSRHQYNNIMDTIADQHHHVSNAIESETQQFGYIGKRLLSLNLTYAALKHAIHSGNAFVDELNAFKDEISGAPEFVEFSNNLDHAASHGLVTDAWITMSARDVAAMMTDAATTQTTTMTTNWFSALKFPVAEKQPTSASSNTSVISEVAVQRDIQDRFMAFVARKQYGEAIEAMEMAMDRTNVAHISAGESMRVAAESFKQKAQDRIVVEHFERFCDAALFCTKFHLIEGVLQV